MKRKKTDTVQLSKIRLREELRQKLAKEAERKAQSLNAEIVERLEDSFEFESQAEGLREQLRAAQKSLEELFAKGRELELAVQRSVGTQKIIDALVGNNKASSDLIRKIAVEVTRNSEWSATDPGRLALAEKIYAYIVNPTEDALGTDEIRARYIEGIEANKRNSE